MKIAGARSNSARRLAFFAAMALLFVCARAFSADISVVLKTAQGKVDTREGETKRWRPAAAGAALAAGWQIKTGPDSEALLLWPKGHAVKIFSLSSMTISSASSDDKSEKTQLDIGKGRIFSKINKLSSKDSSFTVKTPTAIAGVRGTEFMIEIQEDNSSKITLLEGQLDVIGEQIEQVLEQNTSIELGTNMQTPPEPVQITPEVKIELEAISNQMQTEIIETQAPPPAPAPAPAPVPVQVEENSLPDTQEIIQQVIETKVDDIKNEIVLPKQETINLPPLPPQAP